MKIDFIFDCMVSFFDLFGAACTCELDLAFPSFLLAGCQDAHALSAIWSMAHGNVLMR